MIAPRREPVVGCLIGAVLLVVALVIAVAFLKWSDVWRTRPVAGAPVDAASTAVTSASQGGAGDGSRPSVEPSEPPADYAAGDASWGESPDCEDLADVSTVASGDAPGARRATARVLAMARYPAGVDFIEAQSDAQLLAWFTGAGDTFEGTASRFDTAVHEGSHIWGIARFDPNTQSYPVRAGLTIVTKRLRNFARSEILSAHVDPSADRYAKTYLEGASGAQGFNSVLDEYNAYTHSLASRYCTRDLVPANTTVSARDGILTFMYYVETYLELARTKHPADYTAIAADLGHRTMITAVWDRAELWLRRSARYPRLGIDDARLRSWVYEPSRLAEIARVREANTSK